MKTLTIKPESETEFFHRGRVIAKLADAGSTLPEHCVISFDDPSELLKLLSTTRLALIKTIKEQPGSITQLAGRVHRHRSAVKRDVDELEKLGIVTVESKNLPGQGRIKEVRAGAKTFRLEAELA